MQSTSLWRISETHREDLIGFAARLVQTPSLPGQEAGVAKPTIAPIEIATEFPNFEAFWTPFTLGAGPAPGYCTSLPEDSRAALKARLAEALGDAGPVNLTARAWAVKATV